MSKCLPGIRPHLPESWGLTLKSHRLPGGHFYPVEVLCLACNVKKKNRAYFYHVGYCISKERFLIILKEITESDSHMATVNPNLYVEFISQT